jgi:HlyD family secretion protein
VNPRVVVPVLLLLAAAAALGLQGVAGWANRDKVRASGTIEMDEVDIASWVGGRVVELRASEGDTVRAGDTLVVLDRGEVVADLSAQRAQAERAEALWRDLRVGPRPAEIEAAQAEVAAAASAHRLAEAQLKRIEHLHRSQVASAEELDRAQSDFEAAAARRSAAAEQLALLESGYRRDQVVAAGKAALAARAQLEAARSRAGELVLVAPVSGVVLTRSVLPGELAAAGIPVLTLGRPDSLWMRVYVAAPQLGRVRLGAPAEVRVVGSKHGYAARVVEIATRAEFTPRAALTEEEQANLVFGVKLALEPTTGALKAGLPADALIAAAGRGK